MSTTLSLHRGCAPTTLEALDAAPLPQPIGPRHAPLPHAWVVRTLSRQCQSRGFDITRTQLGVNEAGTRMFGVLDFRGLHDDVSWGLGFRNSHDQKFSLWMGASERVFVCDNLAAVADFEATRMHTGSFSRIANDVMARLNGVLDQFPALQDRLQTEVVRLQGTAIHNAQANDLLCRSVDAGILPAGRMWGVRHEYFEPTYPEFIPGNLWSLYNAYTTTLGRTRGFSPAAAQIGGRVRQFLLSAN